MDAPVRNDATPTRRSFGAIGSILMALGAVALAVVGALLLGTGADAAPTCTKNWVGPAGGSFATAANWSPTGVPTTSDYACSPVGSSITVGSGLQSVAGVQLLGSVSASGGELRTGALESSIAGLTLAGGTVSGSATVTGGLTWNSGTFAGAGTTTLAPGSVSTISSSTHSIDTNHVLANQGTMTWTSGYIRVCGSSTLSNSGTFTLDSTSSYTIDNGGCATPGSFTNTGTLAASAANNGSFAGNATLGSMSGPGTIGITGGSASGPAAVNAGATLAVSGGTPTLTLTGPGRLRVTGGTLTTLAGSSWGNLTLAGGTVSGTGTVTTGLDWTSGTFAGAGTTTLAPGSVSTISNSTHYMDTNHVLANQGTTAWTGGYIQLCGTSTLSNAGTFTLDSSAGYTINNNGCVTPGTLTNTATGTLTATTINNGSIEVPVSAAGSVGGPGSVPMRGGVVASGSINLNAGADLNFGDGTASLTVTGPGRLRVTGGTVTTLAGSSWGNLTLAGGTVSGTGTVTTGLDWTSGTFAGAGTTTLAPGSVSTISNSTHDIDTNHVLANQGTTTWTGGYIHLCGSSTLSNSGTFTLDSTAGYTIDNNGCATNGTLTNTATGTLIATTSNAGYITAPAHNAGTISVQAGETLTADALDNVVGTELVGGTYLLTGNLEVSGAHILTNKANVTLTGTGTLRNGGLDAFADLATNAAGATLRLQGGRTLSLSGPLGNAGTLGGSGTLVSSLVTNSGIVDPGGTPTPGIFSITGNYTQTAAGALGIDITGTTVGTGFDRLAVSGTAALNGALSVTSPFTPGLGNNFLIVTAATRTGTFPITSGLTPGGGFSYTPTYNGTGLTLVTSALPGLQVNSVSIVEGNSGTTNLVFTVSMSVASASTVTVQYATANGTAIAPGDYTSTSGTLTYTAGQVSKTVSVPIVGDTGVEADETFSLNLSSPTNAVLSVASGTGTITNDDYSADLGITMTATPLVAVGGNAVYAVSVTNNGPTATTGARITDVLPTGTTLDVAASSAGCTGTTTVTCTIGAMASGGTASRTIALDTTTTGVLTNTVTASGDHPDPVSTNNSATGTTSVAVDQADLEVTQTGPGSSIVGSTETYSMWVQNRGLFDTTGVVLTDSLPAGSTYVSATTSQGSCSHTTTTVTCTIGSLAVSNYAYVSIVVTERTSPATVTNTATVSSAKADSLPSNNSDTVSTTVQALVADAGDDLVVTVGDTVTLDASASAPLDALTSIDWNFGDSATGSGQVTNHVYATPGDYTATVTVHAGASSATDSSVIHVKPVPVQTGLSVTVRNESSTPVAGADVLVVDGDGVRYSDVTNGSGVAVLHGLPDGVYTVAAYKSGLLPGLSTGVTVANDIGTATVALTTGQLATTSVTSHPMTYQEIIAAGIDPTDPANQHVYQFEIYLAFGPFDPPIGLSGTVSGGGFGGSSSIGGGSCSASSCSTSVGDYEVVVTSQIVQGQPTLIYMVIPGRAKFLKEFFDVQLQVTNLAAPGFTLTGGAAEITLPPGISLAPTTVEQATTITMPDIPGGTSATGNWVVRGDTEGFYDLAVDYRAMLSPFNAPVALRGETSTPLHVWAGSGLEMIVDAENAAYDGHPYRVRIGLHNVADVPIYNPSVELLPGPINCVYAPGQTLQRSTDVIAPGDTFWSGDFVVISNLTGQLLLGDSFVKKTAGDVDLADTIISHSPVQTPATAPAISATSEANGVHLTWAPIAGATGYTIWSAPDRTTNFVGPLTGPLGAGATDAHVVTPAGTRYYAVVPLAGPNGVIDMRHRVVAGTSLAAVGPTTVITSPAEAAVVPNGTVTVSGTATDAGNGIGGVEVSTDNGVTWHPATGTTSWSYAFPSGAPGTVWNVQARSFDVGNVRGVATSVSFSVNLYASLTGIVAFVPGADGHKVNLLVDGVPFGTALGNNQSAATQVTAGPHNMSVTAAGDIDLSHYVVVFWGNCSSSGAITAAPDGVISCAALLFNTSVPLPSLSVSDPVIVRPASGTAQAVFTVTLNGVGFFPTSVHYATQDGTATTAAGDYTATSGNLSFTSGPTQTVSVPVSSTSRRGISDTFSLALSAASGATLADPLGTATLVNRQGQFTASVKNTAVTRSTTTAKTASFAVSLNVAPSANEQATVTVATANGTAIAGTDYTALPPTTLTFLAGEKTKVVTVPVAARPAATPTRTFTLVLSAPSANTVVSDTTADGVLLSSGTPVPALPLYVSDSNIVRPAAGTGTATFTVTLGAASASPVTVGYTTADGTATAAAGDYSPASGTLTFAPGETAKTVPVTVSATARHRILDDFRLDLSGPTGAMLGDPSGTARLTNRNGLIGVSIVDLVAVRSASAPLSAQVAVRLSAAPAAGETVTVAVATADGTALAGTDYTAVTTTVTFNAGETVKYVTLPVSVRPVGTPKRAYTATLFGPSTNAYLADTAALINLIGP